MSTKIIAIKPIDHPDTIRLKMKRELIAQKKNEKMRKEVKE